MAFLIFVQSIGFLAMALSMSSYQFKSQRTMFAIRVVSDFTWAVHYYLLDVIHVALTVFIASLRTFLTVFVIPQYRTWVVLGAIISVWFICTVLFLNNGNYLNFLPAITSIIYGISTYYHENYIISRMLMALGKIFWISIGVLSGSLPEVISSSIALFSIVFAYLRHRKLLNKE